MILDLGAGDIPHPGAVTLDLRPGVAQVTADARALPYPDGSVEQIFAFDLLEHFPRAETQGVLKEWRRVLVPEGLLTVRVPNMHALATQIAYWGDKPGGQLDCLLNNVFGGHKWPDVDVHHWGFTPASLNVALTEAGFRVLDNSLELNMRVEAVKAA